MALANFDGAVAVNMGRGKWDWACFTRALYFKDARIVLADSNTQELVQG